MRLAIFIPEKNGGRAIEGRTQIPHRGKTQWQVIGNKTPAEYLLQAIPSPSALGKKTAEN
jgi:hypothetical protein